MQGDLSSLGATSQWSSHPRIGPGLGGYPESAADSDASDDSTSSTEAHLETLVFGDASGFRSGLRSLQTSEKVSEALEDSSGDEEHALVRLETIDDSNLFTIDDHGLSRDEITDGVSLRQALEHDPDSDVWDIQDAVWEDSDDEKLTISLASNLRLRKLRRYEGEDVVNGKEYINRLRKQFQILNPRPTWASQTSTRPRKRQRTEGFQSSGEESSDSDSGLEPRDSAQPLARLLQSGGSMNRAGASPLNDNAPRRRRFRKDVIDVHRIRDIERQGTNPIGSLQIHRTLPILLVSHPSGDLYIHSLKPQQPNLQQLLTSVHVKHTTLTSVCLHPSTEDPCIFIAGSGKYLGVWNMATGKVTKAVYTTGRKEDHGDIRDLRISPDGKHVALLAAELPEGGIVNIISSQTLQWVAEARVDSLKGIADFSWWKNSLGLCIAGKNGEITEWEINSRRVVARWRDEGAVGTTKIALGGDGGDDSLGGDRWIAVGSSVGIVNLYDRRTLSVDDQRVSRKQPHERPSMEKASFFPANPSPMRTFDNLVTSISTISFSPCGQILCMASDLKANALRLVHLPSCLVYKNWPTAQTPLKRVKDVAWGEVDGELRLVVGNWRGDVRNFILRG